MNAATLDAIFDRHGIHPKFHAEFRDLVMGGQKPSIELKNHLKGVSNYRECLDEIFQQLNKRFDRFFRPRS